MSRIPMTPNGGKPIRRRPMPKPIDPDSARDVARWIRAGKTRAERMNRIVRASDGNMTASEMSRTAQRYFRVEEGQR